MPIQIALPYRTRTGISMIYRCGTVFWFNFYDYAQPHRLTRLHF